MEFYRYELDKYESYPTLKVTEYSLVRETPKGYWICRGNPNQLHGFLSPVERDMLILLKKKRYLDI